MQEKTRAKRFIDAYNKIDHSLRVQNNFKRSLSFSDVVRRSVLLNSVVRKYEDELVDYGRLRNAIIHKGSMADIMAEPHEDVVNQMEIIASLVSTPPRVLDTVCQKDVMVLNPKTTIKESMKKFFDSGYNNIPVYDDNILIGVANAKKFVDYISRAITENKNIEEYISATPISDILQEHDLDTYYTVTPSKLTLEEALNKFYMNRKLLVIIVTENGKVDERPLGILTVSDIMDINNILENY